AHYPRLAALQPPQIGCLATPQIGCLATPPDWRCLATPQIGCGPLPRTRGRSHLRGGGYTAQRAHVVPALRAPRAFFHFRYRLPNKFGGSPGNEKTLAYARALCCCAREQIRTATHLVRHPLKMVRLPISPPGLRGKNTLFFLDCKSVFRKYSDLHFCKKHLSGF